MLASPGGVVGLLGSLDRRVRVPSGQPGERPPVPVQTAGRDLREGVGVSDKSVLRVRGLTRRFGGVVAVRDVDLDIAPGERRAVLGPNGAGKSTLFNLIAGADTPTAGTIELFGDDVSKLGARRRTRMGLSRTFQTSRLLTGLTVEDNLYLAAIGVGGGRFRLWRTGRDREARDRARRPPRASG